MSRLDSLQVALDSWCVPYFFFHPHQDHRKKRIRLGFFLVTPCRSGYLIRFGGAFCRVRKEWAEPKPNRLGSAGAWSCCLQDEWPEMDGGWNSSPISAFKAASSWHGTPKCLQEHGKSGNLCFYNWVIGCVWKWRMAFIHGRKQGKMMIKHRGSRVGCGLLVLLEVEGSQGLGAKVWGIGMEPFRRYPSAPPRTWHSSTCPRSLARVTGASTVRWWCTTLHHFTNLDLSPWIRRTSDRFAVACGRRWALDP